MITRYQLGYAPADWHHLDNHEFKSHHDELVQSGMLIKREQGGTYDRYRHRLMFPIHDRHGRIIGFGGRSLDAEQKPKYLNSPETIIFQKNRELYGLHHVLQQHTTPDLIIVVEGYLDVIALAQMGITQAVATLGTATSRFHVQLLSKHTSHVVFCFDGDSAGQKAAWRAVETIMPELSQGLNATFMFLPQQHDPDSFIREQGKDTFMQQLQKALSLNQFFFQTLLKQVDSSTLAGKNQLILTAKPYLLKLPEGPYKQLMLTELARMTHLELHRIEQLIIPTSAEAPSLPIVAMAQIKRTPIRLAMALMLQNPSVYASIKDNIPSAQLPNPHTVLKKIMQEIECNPEATTASLVETFRGSKAFDAINQLAIWQHQVPSAALVDELSDTLLFLIQKNEQHQIKTLIERSRQNDLSESERLTLQTLLRRRHHVKS
jgi:DNA primase